MGKTCLTYEDAIIQAHAVETRLSVNACGVHVPTTKKAARTLIGIMPSAADDGDTWTATDDEGRTVWTFDGDVLVLG